MHYERITHDPKFNGKTRDSHEVRYRIARQYVRDTDAVLDLCCGIGYGKDILADGRPSVRWFGVDRSPEDDETWVWDFEHDGKLTLDTTRIDVVVAFECIEHLNDDGVEALLQTAEQAHRYIILSTPIVPNSNPYHKQQYSDLHMRNILHDNLDWELEATFIQDDTYGIYVYRNIHHA
jgi:SAM-dependent methyltransferase